MDEIRIRRFLRDLIAMIRIGQHDKREEMAIFTDVHHDVNGMARKIMGEIGYDVFLPRSHGYGSFINSRLGKSKKGE